MSVARGRLYRVKPAEQPAYARYKARAKVVCLRTRVSHWSVTRVVQSVHIGRYIMNKGLWRPYTPSVQTPYNPPYPGTVALYGRFTIN